METYRSGHNELDSKSSCRATGTWVRIPPSPLFRKGAVVKQMSNHPFCNSPFCCNIIHIITVKNVICKKSLKLPFPDVNAGHMEHVLFTQPKSASAARGSLFEVCMGLYLISCVKVPLWGQNYGLSRRLCDSTGSDSEKISSKLYFAGIFLLRI